MVVLLASVALGFLPVRADDTTTTTPPTSDPTTTTVPLTARDVRVIYNVPTRDKVVFITIDDGFSPTGELARVIRKYRIPVTTFAMPRLVQRHRRWFMAQDRMTFENHTVNHRLLADLTVRRQRAEICVANRRIEEITGERPILFRPPGGSFNHRTKQALAECGIRHLVMWNVLAEKGRIRINGGKLQRGDIILMHYIDSAAPTLEKLIKLIRREGLRPALLRDYLE